MLVPLTSTQSARPPRPCGSANQRQVTTTAPSPASFASGSRSRGSFGSASRGRRKPGRIVSALLLIVERHRGPFAGGGVLGGGDRRGRGAARVPELPSPERAGFDRGVD